ncbi:hypothetical protein GMST_23080 [Geomonas silvestris]|uniref:Response regulatory domain-containing protein n=1 Tax=Geomonas silvestris TaxID=2740184 RepID=A0A6V8MJL5_9BACT|nr:response regulator [Geomonas silvestris]GFO59983.1 hypothetical protein GMST_23080 [Geomonas silvestris]
MRIDPILFVDDDELYLRLVESIVRQRGIYAHYATCGEQALELMQKHHFESMVTDLNMPGMNGFLLSEEAKLLLPDLRIIMVTSDATQEVRRLAARSGIEEVLEKPACVKQVQAVLQVAAPGMGLFFRPPTSPGIDNRLPMPSR